MNLTLDQINNMKHAIGFVGGKVRRGKFKAYRNYHTTSKPNERWRELVKGGLATGFPFPQGGGENPIMYHVSDKGFKVLEEILEIQIVEGD